MQANPSISLSFRWPAEHGAWGILVVPFLCAAASSPASGRVIPLLLVATCVLSLFLLRGSLEACGDLRALRFPIHLALATAFLAGGAPLVFVFERYQLLALGAAGVLLYLLQRWLVATHQRESEKRSLAAELVGVALLTLSAPAATIAAGGTLDAAGARVWLLNLLFFLGGVLYVKYRVRAILAHQPFTGLPERLAFAWPVFAYHVLLAALLASAALLDSLPVMVLVAFAPAVLRACALLFQLGHRFPIKQLGWSEVAHSVVFALLLILASRP
jgi:hypothetical protein